MTGPIRVLVAEDDVDLQGFLKETLEAEGMTVQAASDGAGALLAVGSEPPDIILLDLDLPDLDGLDVLSAVRKRGDLPIIVLTGRRLEQDRVIGLERGADDYVVKPFSPRELVARIRTVLRRADHISESESPDVLTVDGLVIDRTARDVVVDGRSVELTKREFDLLAFLASHPRRVFSRQELLSEVWGSSEEWQVPATVTEHIRRVRLKVEPDPANPRWIHNVRGVGYRFGS
jgi:two-component system, OmpR family, phosphate regulon response regulator PhoB